MLVQRLYIEASSHSPEVGYDQLFAWFGRPPYAFAGGDATYAHDERPTKRRRRRRRRPGRRSGLPPPATYREFGPVGVSQATLDRLVESLPSWLRRTFNGRSGRSLYGPFIDADGRQYKFERSLDSDSDGDGDGDGDELWSVRVPIHLRRRPSIDDGDDSGDDDDAEPLSWPQPGDRVDLSRTMWNTQAGRILPMTLHYLIVDVGAARAATASIVLRRVQK